MQRASIDLPTSSTPFIGRSDELVQIADLLAAPDCRLLTLVGPGGMGKTRLAVEAARQTRFPDGVCFVPLQSLSSSDFIVPAIAQALNFQFYVQEDSRQQLLDYLHGKSLLLVLDNLEHVLDGVHLLPEILNHAPDVRLLATSRERLNLQEEWVLEIGGLSYPLDEAETDTEPYSAFELFVRHARRVNNHFMLTDEHKPAINRICRLVGGMPLGIELAASWIRALTCEHIADQIESSLDILETPARNVEPRHRTMRAAFAPTWEQLTDQEQSIFRKLSVFRGGFTHEAAEYVTGASLRTLSMLVDKSLLRVDENGRYDLHELLRQFGAEQLSVLIDEASYAHSLHCAYYTHLLETQWARLTGSQIKAALTTITVELNNVWKAWDWAVSHYKAAEVESALRSLWFFCGVTTHYQEGAQVFARAASVFSDNPAIHGKLKARWGELEYLTGSFGKARALLQESLILLRQVGARSDIAFVLYRLVWLDMNSVDRVREAPNPAYVEECLAIYTELDDHFGIGEALVSWGYYYLNQYLAGRQSDVLERSESYFQAGLAAFQKHESEFGIAVTHLALFEVAQLRQDYRYALHCVQVSGRVFRDLDIPWGIMWALAKEGLVFYKLGDFAAARRCVLENLLRNLERGFDLSQPQQFNYRAERIVRSLHLAAAILIDEGKQKRGYELLRLVGQQFVAFNIRPDNFAFFLPAPVDQNLPLNLADADHHRPLPSLEMLVREVIAELAPAATIEPSGLQNGLLTEREMEILRLLTDGLDSREIADRLYLSVGTIRWYIKQIYSKLDAHSRSQAIARARELQLLA